MDNLTHSLVGLVVARSGVSRLSFGATTLCILAANSPDLDIVTSFSGRWVYLQQHRGISHSILGVLVLALLLPCGFYLVAAIFARIRGKPHSVRLWGLLLASIVATATHPLLDWTNSYGLRPFLPWNPRWYYGDFVFIVDPWLWLGLGGAAFLLTSTTKWRVRGWAALAVFVSVIVLLAPLQRVGYSNPLFLRVSWVAGIIFLGFFRISNSLQGRKSIIAGFALALVVAYSAGLVLAHRTALKSAQSFSLLLAAENRETIVGVAALPTFANPLKWQVIAETDKAYYRLYVYAREESHAVDTATIARFEKPAGYVAAAVNLASKDPGAKVFLGFARFPAFRVVVSGPGKTVVQFADLRFGEPGPARGGSFSLEVPVENAPPLAEEQCR